jgi:hypothetical protein
MLICSAGDIDYSACLAYCIGVAVALQYLTFLTLSALWDIIWVLATRCALIFTAPRLTIEMLVLRASCLLVAVLYVIIAVCRILLIFAERFARPLFASAR